MNTHVLEYDIVVVGGGTAGPMAAIKAKERDPSLRVLLLEGEREAQRRDLDGDGRTEQRRDSGPRDARTVHARDHDRERRHRRSGSGPCLCDAQLRDDRQLDRWGVKFEKDGTGDYAVKKVHHMGSYVLPMPEGHDIRRCCIDS